MITKKEKQDQDIGHASRKLLPTPLHFTYNLNFTPLCVGIKPLAHFSSLAPL